MDNIMFAKMLAPLVMRAMSTMITPRSTDPLETTQGVNSLVSKLVENQYDLPSVQDATLSTASDFVNNSLIFSSPEEALPYAAHNTLSDYAKEVFGQNKQPFPTPANASLNPASLNEQTLEDLYNEASYNSMPAMASAAAMLQNDPNIGINTTVSRPSVSDLAEDELLDKAHSSEYEDIYENEEDEDNFYNKKLKQFFRSNR